MHHVTDARVVLGRHVYIAPTAYVGGAVTLGDHCTVMHHVTIRGDVSVIRIGHRVNIQDGSVVHTQNGIDLEIGDGVSIGHRAVVHCKTIGPGSLIGIGAIILDGCEVGQECIIAAGALLPPNTKVPDGQLVMGVPGRVVRQVTEKEKDYLRYVVENYVKLGERHGAGEYPNIVPSRGHDGQH